MSFSERAFLAERRGELRAARLVEFPPLLLSFLIRTGRNSKAVLAQMVLFP